MKSIIEYVFDFIDFLERVCLDSPASEIEASIEDGK